jgi:type II secretory pathway component PulK
VVVFPNDNPYLQGRFSLIALPDPDQAVSGTQTTYSYGVTDEASKINVNAVMQQDSSGQTLQNMLLQLPNMTQDVVDAVIDWIDADEQPRASGAESDYYSGLTPPYNTKDGPLDSIEELLLVRGVTPQLLLGNDRNRNGQLDPGEDDGSGGLNPGWAAYLTVYSRELNLDSTGNQRIYINDGDLTTLLTNLQNAVGNDMAIYILAYRLYGGSAAGAGGGSAPTSNFSANAIGNLTSSRNARPISSIYQLINTTVSIPATTPNGRATTYGCPLNNPSNVSQLLPQLLDKCTTNKNLVLPGRINVNTASQTVLSGLPGLAATDVQNIIQSRPAPADLVSGDPTFQSTAWLLTQANLKPTQLQALDPYITARSRVFRVQSLGYFDKGGTTARIEAVIDTNGTRPRIVYWRDLTRDLGKGFVLTGNASKQ